MRDGVVLRDRLFEVHGPVAQLVARLVRIEEVRGSNPLRSTILSASQRRRSSVPPVIPGTAKSAIVSVARWIAT